MNDPITEGPGIPAFIAFAFLVIALWLLMRNMNARLRRMSYQRRAEEEARRADVAGSPAGEQVDAQDDPGDNADGDSADGQAGR